VDFRTRTFGKAQFISAGDFVPYGNTIKAKCKRFKMNILARNAEGKKAWYLMQYSRQLVPFMDWVIQNYFPADGRVLSK
jgi:hypothetical protein